MGGPIEFAPYAKDVLMTQESLHHLVLKKLSYLGFAKSILGECGPP